MKSIAHPSWTPECLTRKSLDTVAIDLSKDLQRNLTKISLYTVRWETILETE